MRYQAVLVVAWGACGARADGSGRELHQSQRIRSKTSRRMAGGRRQRIGRCYAATQKIMGVDPGIAAVFYGPVSDAFAPNVNVIVADSVLILNSATEKQVIAVVKAGLSATGVGQPELKANHLKVAGKTCLALAYETVDKASGKARRTWQVMIPGKKLYTVTCVALASQWADSFPNFKAILDSLRIDQQPKKGQ